MRSCWKKLAYLSVFVLLSSFASAGYTTYKDYCAENSGFFVAECPHDHRVEGDWFKYRHYTKNESLAHCDENGTLVYDDCPFEILPWNHPKVTGRGIHKPLTTSIHDDSNIEVPEFGAMGAVTAFIGAGVVFLRTKKKR